MLLSEIAKIENGRMVTKDAAKVIASGEGWDFWLIGGDVYRARSGEQLDVYGNPQAKRWECSLAHWNRYKNSVFSWAKSTDSKTIFGYSWEEIQARQNKTYKPETINVNRKGDYGADPLGNGKFKMVPSGDIVDLAERNRRLSKDSASGSLPSITFQDIKIAIENDIGSIREGIGYNNQPFKVRMVWPYGYIEDTVGMDGEEIDCFVGPDSKAEEAFIIWEKASGEEKVMLGFPTQMDAVDAFCIHYQPNPLDFLGTITRVNMDDFKKVLGAHKKGAKLAQGGI